MRSAVRAAELADLPGDPDGFAVSGAGERVSRAALDAWAWGVAAGLRAEGVRPGDLVPVIATRGPAMLAAELGVLRAGAAYCPLSPDLPSPRLSLLIRDLHATVAVVDEAGAAAMVGRAEPLRTVDVHARHEGPAAPVELEIGPEQPAYVMYTSGTTGRPKGVVVSRGNLAAYVSALHQRHPELVGARHLLASSAYTDFAVTVTLAALASGGSVVVATERESVDGAALAELVRAGRVEVAKLTPSHLAALLDTPFRDMLARLPVLVLGGEASSARLIAALSAVRPADLRTLNHYGPTETTVGVFTHPLDLSAPGVPPIGRPLSGVSALILDEELREVPEGTLGQLWIGGPQVASGYLGQADATAAAFRADPDGGWRHRTGDLAFRDADGLVHLRGRADDQLKIRGHRVEPGEARHALLALPGVLGAEVLGHQGELAAFLVLRDGSSAESVIGLLRRELPPQLIPTRVRALIEMPRDATGKVDRMALRALLEDETPARDSPPDPTDAATASQSPEDWDGADSSRILAAVQAAWCSVLSIADAAPDVPFFEAGGDSLKLLSLADRLNALVPGTLRAGDLFEHATVRSQAELVHAARLAGPGATVATTPHRAAFVRRTDLAARRARTHRPAPTGEQST